jgi:hypothetical protein
MSEKIKEEIDLSMKTSVHRYLKDIIDNKAVMDKNNVHDLSMSSILINYPYFVSNFVARYQWKKDQRDLYGAYLTLATSLTNYIT